MPLAWRKELSARRYLAFALPVLIVGAWGIISSREPESAEALAMKMASAARAGDWRTVYGLSSNRERAMVGWSEDQFVTLMDELSKGGQRALSHVDIVVAGKARFAGMKVFSLRFLSGEPEHEQGFQKSSPPMVARRDDSGWRIDIATWPIALCWQNQGEGRRQCQLLAGAMGKAGLSVLPVMGTGIRLDRSTVEGIAMGRQSASAFWGL